VEVIKTDIFTITSSRVTMKVGRVAIRGLTMRTSMKSLRGPSNLEIQINTEGYLTLKIITKAAKMVGADTNNHCHLRAILLRSLAVEIHANIISSNTRLIATMVYPINIQTRIS
jgi:hypothetical protein